MRILINALSARQRGGQTYLKNLLRFVPRDGSIDILLLAPASLELGFEHPYVHRRGVPRVLENPVLRAAWEKLMLPRLARDYGADVLFCPGGVVNSAPARCAVVTMFRNMIPFDERQRRRYPLGYQRMRNWLLHHLMLRSMLSADLVIFISHFAKRVVESHANRPLGNTEVIPHGIAQQFRSHSPAVPGSSVAVPAAGYLLYVSYIDFYKAQIEVVRAYALLKQRRETPEKLMLVGPENPDYGKRLRQEIAHLGLTSDVIVTGALPYGEMPYLYRNAAVNIFASETENCPNILLEAMAAGRPVVSSNRAPMPEFAGDSVLYFDPAVPAELTEKLLSLLDEPAALADCGRRAAEQSRLYEWEETARRTWNAIRRTRRVARPAGQVTRFGEEH